MIAIKHKTSQLTVGNRGHSIFSPNAFIGDPSFKVWIPDDTLGSDNLESYAAQLLFIFTYGGDGGALAEPLEKVR